MAQIGRARKATKRPRLPPNVRARWSTSHGAWRFRADCRVGIDRLYGPWREDLDQAARDAREFRSRGKLVSEPACMLITLEEAMQLVLRDLETKARRPRTVDWYREHFIPVFRHFGQSVPLHRITVEEIENYIRARRGKVAMATIRADLRALNRCFNLAIKRGFPGQNPIAALELPQEKPKEPDFYSADEVTEILDSIRLSTFPTAELLHQIVAVLFFSGLRLGELSRLRARDVDLSKGLLEVDGKTGRRRIPLNKPLRHVLDELVQDRDAGDHLVPGVHGAQRDWLIKGMFQRWKKHLPKKIQKGFHAHTLRHSFETFLAEHGVAFHHIAALMGHTTRRHITMRYAHASLPALRESMRVFDSLLHLVKPASLRLLRQEAR